jgi:hypothetical protein
MSKIMERDNYTKNVGYKRNVVIIVQKKRLYKKLSLVKIVNITLARYLHYLNMQPNFIKKTS